MTTNISDEGKRPLYIFLVNETDRALEFCDPNCEWGQEGTPMVKHDRYITDPKQTCIVFARERDLLVGSSPFGPKGQFGMRFTSGLGKGCFNILYHRPIIGKTTVEVCCPPGYIHFISNDSHLQEPHASVVIHLLKRP